MADGAFPIRFEPTPLELEVEPTVAGRLAAGPTSANPSRTRRGRPREHASIDLGFGLVERDSTIGGGLLAGALAYRLFVFLLPTALLLVSGLGLYAGSVDKSPTKVAEEAGLHGLIASQVASAASGRARWLVFLLMVPAVLYAMANSTARSRRCMRSSGTARAAASASPAKGVGVFAARARPVRGRRDRRLDPPGTTNSAVSPRCSSTSARRRHVARRLRTLPHREVRWPALVPGRAAVRRRPAVRQRLQRLRHDPPGRGPRRHLRRARGRHRVALLARARRPADGRLCGAQRVALRAHEGSTGETQRLLSAGGEVPSGGRVRKPSAHEPVGRLGGRDSL